MTLPLLLFLSLPLLSLCLPYPQRSGCTGVMGDSLSLSSIIIGAPASFSPQDTYFDTGTHMVNSWILFAQWINLQRGGIHINGENVSVTVTYIEDYSDSAYVSSATDYLLSKGVDFMFAPYSSSLTTTCSDITERNATLLMAGAASSVSLDVNLTLLTLPDDISSLRSCFRAFVDMDASNVVVIKDNNVARCQYSDVVFAAQHEKIELAGFYELDPLDANYHENLTTIIATLKSRGVETLLGCSFDSLCLQIPRIAQSLDYNPSGMSFSICLSNLRVVEELGRFAEYLYTTTPWAPLDSIVGTITGWSASEFDDIYYANFLQHPPYQAASVFASALLLSTAIEMTQTLDPYILSDFIKKEKFQTFYANISFNDSSQTSFDSLIQQMLYTGRNGDYNLYVVKPDAFQERAPVFPMPTWRERECNDNTDYCSGHGICTDQGNCTCDANYYGGNNAASCDTYCDGDITGGYCKSNRVLYVGGMISSTLAEYDEYSSALRLAIDLVNNKSDGWFDDTPQITIKVRLNDTQCDGDVAYAMVLDQENWARENNNGNELDGVIGALCSDASEAIAGYGTSVSLPQISFASTADDLSDTDTYSYFSRTCPSDYSQGTMLANTLNYFGIKPYVTVVYMNGFSPTGLTNDFIAAWEGSGNIVLKSVLLENEDEDSSYDDVIDAIAATGAPAVVLVLYQEEVGKILRAAQKNDRTSSTDIVWLGVEYWTDTQIDDPDSLVNGILGLSPYESNSTLTRNFYDLWASLDSSQYIDSDGDRTTLSPYTTFVVDAVFTLALAYQQAIDDNTGLDGSLFRQYVFQVIAGSIQFDGVSGFKDFNTYGDQVSPLYTIKNYQISDDGSTGWVNVGSVNISTTLDVDLSTVLWPDGSVGITSSYSSQLSLYCPEGMEPVQISLGFRVCTQCAVGYYSPNVGPGACKKCPVGADCNDVGVVVPCVLPGYWRPVPPQDAIGDFEKYKIYSCDDFESCLGGCVLNTTCRDNRDQIAPVCAVCTDGYYLLGGQCLECSQSSEKIGFMKFLVEAFFVYFVLVVVVWMHISYKGHERYSVSSIVPRNTSEAFEKLLPRTAVTFKLVISFWQVMTAAYYNLSVEWPQSITHFFGVLRFNPFDHLYSSAACADVSFLSAYSVLILFFVLPFAFLLTLVMSFATVFYFGVHKYEGKSDQWVRQSLKSMWDCCARIFIWFCLLIFTQGSSVMISFFNCRDFGVVGVYLKGDYTVDCSSDTYKSYAVLAALGILLYPVGIAFLFFAVIRYRDHPLFERCSMLLYRNFEPQWRYFELYELFRKMLLTSLFLYVSDPESPSRALYLLIVDIIGLIVLSFCRPYMFRSDDILSSAFVMVECFTFLVALLVLSGVSDTDNYHQHVLYNTLFACLILVIAIIVPCTFVVKIDYVNSKLYEYSGVAANKLPDTGRTAKNIKSLTRDRLQNILQFVRRRSSGLSSMESSVVGRCSATTEMTEITHVHPSDELKQRKRAATIMGSEKNPIKHDIDV